MRIDLFQLGERDFVREARAEATIEVVKSEPSFCIGRFVSISCIEPGGDLLDVVKSEPSFLIGQLGRRGVIPVGAALL
jgi:hypothetical protein